MMKKRWIACLLASVLILGNTVGFAADFNDVTDAHAWAKETIENYAERGILAGDGKGSFMPDNSVTRAEFAKMLCLVFGLEQASEIAYADVTKDGWQYDYIAKTDAYTYTEGKESYAPDKSATRAEIAYAVVNAAGLEAKEAEMPFEDADKTNPALAANVNTAYALGILKGYPDNTFRPDAPVTRAEVVVLLARAEAALEAQKPEEKPEAEPEEKEEEKPEENTSVLIEPMETLCYVDSVTESIHPETEEDCLRLNIYVSGNETMRSLYVNPDVPVRDINGAAATLKTGDVFCINTNLYGTVKEIYIVLRMGDSALLAQPTGSETAFLDKLYVPTAQKWGYLEEDKKHEVYLGFFGDVQYDGVESKIYIYPSDGKYNSDGVRVLALTDETKVLTYTTNAKKKNRYAWETVESMQLYGATKDDYGNIIWESTSDTKYYQYVFVKTKEGVVTDFVLISNQ